MKGHFTSETLFWAKRTEWVGGWSTELVRMFWRTEKCLDLQGPLDLTLGLSREKEVVSLLVSVALTANRIGLSVSETCDRHGGK
jgi:hypothetical protein